MKAITRNFLFIIPVAFLFLFSSSCKKNKDCDVVITVIDGATSAPIGGCVVNLHPNQGTNNLQIQDQTGTTDAAGIVSFTFKLPAILQADVSSIPAPFSCTTSCSALVKLEEGKSVSKTIKVY